MGVGFNLIIDHLLCFLQHLGENNHNLISYHVVINNLISTQLSRLQFGLINRGSVL